MSQKLLIAVLLLLSVVGCSRAPNSSSLVLSAENSDIIGGSPATSVDDISSSIVAIYDTQKKALCTGSILSETLILTAAHCAVDSTPSSLVVLFGLKLMGGSKPESRKVMETRIHPDYLALMQHLKDNPRANFNQMKDQGDVALIRFQGGLPAGYKAAQLLMDGKQLIKGAPVEIAGYGITDGAARTGAGTLRMAQVQIYNSQFSPTEILFDQRNQIGACHGDSGGPAYLLVDGSAYLFGVTSRGYRDPHNNCEGYSVYTNILAQQDFLQQAARELSSPSQP